MPDDIHYECWNLKPVDIPARSFLYSIPPIGIGTPQVESLSGYIARLAEAHAISVGDLFGRKPKNAPSCWIIRRSHFYRSRRPKAHSFHATGSGINGMFEWSQKWVRILEEATCQQGLVALTLRPLQSVLSDMALFRRDRAWCSSCYQDDRKTGVVYERLLWTIDCVTICPRHLIHLHDRCPRCEKMMQPLAVHSRPGHCSFCGAWLGNNQGERVRFDSGADYNIYVAQEVELLLRKLNQGRFSKKNFRTNLNISVGRLTAGNRHAFAEFGCVAQSAVQSWCDGAMRPTLDALLRLCFHLCISPTVLMTSHRMWGVDWSRIKQQFIYPRQVTQQSRTPKELRALMAAALAADKCPSISMLSKSLGYKRPERLYQVDRMLCHRITQRHRKCMRTHWWRRPGAKRICEVDKIQDLLEEALAQDRPPSVRSIAARLGYANGGFLKGKFPELCRAIAEKCKAWEARQLDNHRTAIRTACLEQPPPTLKNINARLGFRHSSALHLRFPAEVQRLENARAAYKKEQQDILRRELRKTLSEKPAPSLQQVASRLGMSCPWLAERCPDLCKAISRRFCESQRKQTQIKHNLLNKAVSKIAKHLYNKGMKPTHKSICQLLDPTLIKDWSAIQRALKAATRHFLKIAV
jgi:hypothetical protein